MRGHVRTSSHSGHHEPYSRVQNAMCKRWDTPYFLSRLNHQTTLLTTVGGQWQPLALANWLTTVEGQLLERPIFLGEKERVAARLIVARVPEAIVNERRRKARKNAKKKGYTPSQAHLTLLAWSLFITNVPPTIWKTETVLKVYPLR